MLEKLMKMYAAAMLHPEGVGSPMPHLFGPPGCGKSTMVSDLAKLVGKELHIINVSRISPLELEGVQMPDKDNKALTMLPATFWTQLKDGDILLLDEFLRGFPEVYNGLLDILTSRRVGSHRLANVFIIGASNTTVAYDSALEDRLLHLTVPDPRKLKSERTKIGKRIIAELGLLPAMENSGELKDLLAQEILPTYEILDYIGKGSKVGTSTASGHSIRNLIGQARLREVQSDTLIELIEANNRAAMADGKYQFVMLLSGENVDPRYVEKAQRLQGNPKLTTLQAHNLEMNMQLIEMEAARKEREEEDDDLFTPAV